MLSVAMLMPPDGSARIVWAKKPPITYIPKWSPRVRLYFKVCFFDSSYRKSDPSREFSFSYFNGDVGGAEDAGVVASTNGR